MGKAALISEEETMTANYGIPGNKWSTRKPKNKQERATRSDES